MLNRKIKHIVQLGFISILSIGLVISLGYWLGSAEMKTAVAAPLANLTVTIGDSSFADDGQCSLREAIVNANQDTQAFTSAGECSAGSGADSIIVGIDVTLTITDNNADGNGANGLPVITSTIVISGDGHTLSRDGASPPFRFFYLNQGGSSNLTLNDMTITNGDADVNDGGALLMTAGQADVISVTFSHNQADSGGAIYRSGTLRINNSRFIANQTNSSGGAITYTSSGAGDTIINSLFDGNSTLGRGGALSINTGPNIVNTTFINNSAGNNGGAMSNSNQYAPRLYNVTIISNTATNGGGWYSFNFGSTPLLYNSLMSGNSATNSGDDCGGPSLSGIEAKNNVFGMNGNDGGCNGFAVSSANNSIATGALSTIVETDGSGNAILADNGGATETIAVIANSPAVNAGDNALLPDESTLGLDGDNDGNVDDPIDYDQRGFARPQVSVADAGAYESGFGPCSVETTGDNVTDYVSDDASAVQTAVNAASPNDLIKIAGTCAGVQVQGGISQTVYISQNLTIQGGYTNTNWLVSDPDTYTTTLDAQRQGRVAVITGTIEVTLDGLVLSGGGGITAVPGFQDDGAGIWTNSTLTLTHSSVISNLITITEGDDGAGIYIKNGTLTIADSTIADNENQNDDGGGMHIDASVVTMVRTFIQNNRTKENSNTGGGIYVRGSSTVDISDSAIRNNYTQDSSANGGGLYMMGSSIVTVTNTLIENNETLGTSANGGAVRNSGGDLIILNSVIQNNHTYGSSANGGGLYHSGGDLIILNSVIQNNHAYGPSSTSGGGLYHSGSVATIVGTRILSNTTANGNGGGVYIADGITNIKDSVIANNQSLDPSHPGGGLAFNQNGNNQKFVTLENVTFSGNSSASEGGAIWVPNGFLTMTHVTLSDNSAITSTGGISVGVNGSVNMANSIIANSTGDDCLNAGTFIDGGYNLVEDGNCISAGTSISGDPNLGALADNGGDTLTHALLAGSIAIDAGDPTYPVLTDDYDQRGAGYARVENGRLDIGAYEFDAQFYIFLPVILK
ncbi:MAG: hypothetical protein GY942_18165 [Aestuariibacter sp.]|nr:hypothetical protein [Aestuariibacter sp.]